MVEAMTHECMQAFGPVVVVGPLPPPAGGMANQTRQLTELLRAAQAEVTLVQTNSPYRPTWIQRFSGVRAVFRLVPYVRSLWRATSACTVMHVIANSGWAWHLFAVPAIWVGWLRKVPVVINYRGGEASEFLAKSQGLVRFSMRRVARLIVPSAFLGTVFARHGMSSTIVPNVVDLGRFHPRSIRSDDSAHLVVARNLEPLYDNETALRAFQIVHFEVPGSRLTIAGSGPQNRWLRELALDLGLKHAVEFVGSLNREEMAALYRSADLMINPSLVDNMPNSILESMATGVPVVSTNVGGVPFMVRDGITALLVPPSDPHAMAAACLKLLRNNALWRQLSETGLIEVQRYTWGHVAPLLASVYRQAIAEKRGQSFVNT